MEAREIAARGRGRMAATDISNPKYFHKVVDCQWACPTHTPVPEYIRLIAQGRYAAAYMLNWESNVFPGILGRVCDRPCEPACRRGRIQTADESNIRDPSKKNAEPVAICRLKRVAADYKGDVDAFMPEIPNVKNGKRIALLGAGPASLTVARDLMPLGYACTLFERDPTGGGLMRTNIPSFRLPASVLDEEVNRIVDFGVEMRFGHEVKSLKAVLDEGFDAVFVGTGAPKGKDLSIPGRKEAAANVHIGIDWLTSVAFAHVEKVGKRVVVIGGGNTAMDCCRTALRLGAEKVTVTVRSPRKVMKASDWEIKDALHEGIPILDNHAPKAFIVEKGKLVGMRFEKMVEKGVDAKGRPKLEPSGEEVVIECDDVLMAIGQENAFPWIERDIGIEFGEWEMPTVDRKTFMSSRPGVFFGGDAAWGPENIIWAVAPVIYQVYPRSFQDTNGDGIGDLKGIERRLDYLAALGVDAIWISPIYPSPMADFGYDIADYCGVDSHFGALADFDELLAQAHARGLKVLLDFVPNHTSDRHPWFIESRSSRENPKRDWYLWRDPAPDAGPPNNWISDFGGSAWTWDAATGQYYYQAFLKEQADLNWRNPAVQAAMFDVMRFWLDRGVDGFRIDVLWHMVKAADFPDNPPNPNYRPEQGEMHRVLQLHSTDQPEVHGIAADMRTIADSYGASERGERVLIGEIYLPVDRLMHYYGHERAGVHLPFNFQLIDAPWKARSLAKLIAGYEAALPADGWPNWVLGNHDRSRIAAKRGQAQARVAAMLLLTLRGTPTLYYGDELGLGDVAIPAAQVQDPRELREPGLALGRDPVRTPMPWDGSPNAGFTAGRPWLPLNSDWPTRNAARMVDEPHSILMLYCRLLAARRAHPALSIGDLALLDAEGDVLAYERRHNSERLIVALNLRTRPHRLQLPDWARDCRPLLSTLADAVATRDGVLLLRGNEGVILTRD